ncbi:hypothetical protein SPHINGO8BC_51219 [Sphingobacterium multivorum]|uniref:Uncharacterized protein n=1 Tax=Sphingobacterium multivorum TaxID=28454 RepID=A0A654CTS9_SPHMU|nr:hypothetical protein SPHINGO8BC_51219 [Sphingobacterium multivorum]
MIINNTYFLVGKIQISTYLTKVLEKFNIVHIKQQKNGIKITKQIRLNEGDPSARVWWS